MSVLTGFRDWHKLLCEQWGSFVDKPDSDRPVRRVILLPEGSSKPVFYWMPVNERDGEYSDEEKAAIEFASDLGVPYRDARSGYILPADDQRSGVGSDMPNYVSLVVGMRGHGEHLDHGITMMVKDSFFHYPPSKCLARLLGDEVADNFRGPILFLRMTRVECSSITLDIDASDFTLALDALAEFAEKQRDPSRNFGNDGSKSKKVCGVKVNAYIPYLGDVRVLRTNPVFAEGGRDSAISKKLGLPLRTYTCATEGTKQVMATLLEGKASDEETSDDGSSERDSMLPSVYLHISIDPNSPDFGTTPPGMENETASTMVFSADKSAINVSTLAALCDFIRDVARPSLTDTSWSSREDRQRALESVVEMWKQRRVDETADSDEDEGEDDAVNSSDDESESEDEDEEHFYDAGDYDDLADVRAKMGQMQMTTTDLRNGSGHI